MYRSVDSMLLEQVIDAVPSIKGPRSGLVGRAGARPSCTATRGTTTRAAGGRCAGAALSRRIARRGIEPSQRLGRHRYVVQRSLAWLVGHRRLQVRHEQRADILLGFVQLACALTCLNSLRGSKV
jgi:hypothetical protein